MPNLPSKVTLYKRQKKQKTNGFWYFNTLFKSATLLYCIWTNQVSFTQKNLLKQDLRGFFSGFAIKPLLGF